MTTISITRDDKKATAIIKAIGQIDDGLELAPIVRCKDCKRSGMYAFGVGDRTHLACLEVEEDGFIRCASAVEPDDFCSHGERRSE